MIDRATIARLGQVDLTDLNYLSLSLNDELENEDLRFLKRISNLQKLNLRGTEISDDAIVHLVTAKSLRELDIRGTRISSSGLDRLQVALPDCEILFWRNWLFVMRGRAWIQ